MDPITASGVFTLGKELINKVSNSLNSSDSSDSLCFEKELDKSQVSSPKNVDSILKIQDLENDLKSELLKDPKTAKFFQENQENTVYLEKRADGSVQFVSSSGQSLTLQKENTCCTKADLVPRIGLEVF